jgi:hypothetical protein
VHIAALAAGLGRERGGGVGERTSDCTTVLLFLVSGRKKVERDRDRDAFFPFPFSFFRGGEGGEDGGWVSSYTVLGGPWRSVDAVVVSEEESAEVAAAVHSVAWFQSTGADVDAGADALSASFSCLVPTAVLTM